MPYPGYLPFLPTSLPLLGVCAEFLSLQWPILPAFLVLLFRVSSAFYIAEGLAPPWFGLFNALIYMYMKVRAVPSRSEPLPRPWALGFGFGSAPRPRQASRGYRGYCGAHGMVQSPSLPSGSSTYPFPPFPYQAVPRLHPRVWLGLGDWGVGRGWLGASPLSA